jgi:ankyrin repeat protein
MLAASKGNPDIIQALISAGADLNTALILAITQRKPKIQKALIKLGADLNFALNHILEQNLDPTCINLDMMLLKSAKKGNRLVVQTLLKFGADINVVDKRLIPPLMLASIWNRKDLVLMLIAAGADPHAVTRHGNTALKLVADHEHIDTVKALLTAPGNYINIKDRTDECALIYATKGLRSTPIVKALLSTPGINLNITDRSGDTPLIWAARYGDVEKVDILISAGADLNVRSESGHTALYCAVLGGYDAIVALLIADRAKLKINLTDIKKALDYTAQILVSDFETCRLQLFFRISSMMSKEDLAKIILNNRALEYFMEEYYLELEAINDSILFTVLAIDTNMENNLVKEVLMMLRPKWYPLDLYNEEIKNAITQINQGQKEFNKKPLSSENTPVKPVIFSSISKPQKPADDLKKVIRKVRHLKITRCNPKVKIK